MNSLLDLGPRGVLECIANDGPFNVRMPEFSNKYLVETVRGLMEENFVQIVETACTGQSFVEVTDKGRDSIGYHN